MSISQETIAQIKEQIDIVDVLGDFITLKKVGQSYRALSPFTDEKTPSFYVSPSKGIFKDFSSGKGGDAIAFIMELEGLSYIETIKFLGKKYGIEIVEEEKTDEEVAAQNERESLYIVLNFANDYFQQQLWENDEGRQIGLSYFRERGFSDPIIKTFELGYSLKQWDGMLNAALHKGFTTEQLAKAGLIIEKESKTYDRYRGRVIFPIHNITGKPIAFGARILVTDKKQPKYINSPETSVYHKSNVLYGIHQAKQAIRNADNCFIVEGYTDVISLHLSDVKNVVSSSGTALTTEQIKLISRYTSNITMLFDGDAAGIRASLRGVDMILASGMNVKVVTFPEGEDPDSYARNVGTTAFQTHLEENATDFITFKVKLFADEAGNDPVKKAATIHGIVESIAKIPDPIQRAVYLQQSSKLLEIDESVLIAEQNKVLIKQHRAAGKEKANYGLEKQVLAEKLEDENQKSVPVVEVNAIEWQEKESIRILLTYGLNEVEDHGKLSDYMLQELADINFETPIYAEMLSIIKAKLKDGILVDADYLLKNGAEHIRQEVINLTTEKYDVSENWHDMYKIYVPKESDIVDDLVYTNIHRLKLRIIQKLTDDQLEKLKHEPDPNKQEDLLKIITSYKKMEMDIAKVLGNIIAR